MNRVTMQDGYNIPFNGYKRRRRSSAQVKAAKRMKACAKKWSGKGSYRAHMKRCLRKGKR